jgi:hypothetical protein
MILLALRTLLLGPMPVRVMLVLILDSCDVSVMINFAAPKLHLLACALLNNKYYLFFIMEFH